MALAASNTRCSSLNDRHCLDELGDVITHLIRLKRVELTIFLQHRKPVRILHQKRLMPVDEECFWKDPTILFWDLCRVA